MYILFGNETLGNRRKMYIGQTHNIHTRLKSHLKKKDFWECAYIFSLIDEQFNSSQIQYLEHITIKTAIECGYSDLLENCQIPVEPYLSNNDKDFVLCIFNYIKILLEFSGIHLFYNKIYDVGEITKKNNHNVISRIVKEYQSKKSYHYDDCDSYSDCEDDEIATYIMRGDDYYAEAIILTDGKVMIMPHGYVSKRQNLMDMNSYVDVENCIDKITHFIKKDIIVDDLAVASKVILGYTDENKWVKKVYNL